MHKLKENEGMKKRRSTGKKNLPNSNEHKIFRSIPKEDSISDP